MHEHSCRVYNAYITSFEHYHYPHSVNLSNTLLNCRNKGLFLRLEVPDVSILVDCKDKIVVCFEDYLWKVISLIL